MLEAHPSRGGCAQCSKGCDRALERIIGFACAGWRQPGGLRIAVTRPAAKVLAYTAHSNYIAGQHVHSQAGWSCETSWLKRGAIVTWRVTDGEIHRLYIKSTSMAMISTGKAGRNGRAAIKILDKMGALDSLARVDVPVSTCGPKGRRFPGPHWRARQDGRVLLGALQNKPFRDERACFFFRKHINQRPGANVVEPTSIMHNCRGLPCRFKEATAVTPDPVAQAYTPGHGI